jgi:long-chain acyl-CoA synthetase
MTDGTRPFETSARDDTDDYSPSWPNFAAQFAARPDDDRVYLISSNLAGDGPAQWTVAEWRGAVLRVAARLACDHGVTQGDRVATLGGNSPEVLALAFATWLLGACLVPLDLDDNDERHALILSGSGARWIGVGPEADLRARAGCHVGVECIQVSDLLAPRPGEVPPPVLDDVSSLDVPALRVYTSGTTGMPKSILLTMRSMLINFDSMRQGFGWDASTRVITVLPIHHVNGLLIGSFLPWFVGGSVVLCDKFRSSFWQVAAETKATTSSLVPTILEVLLSQERTPPADCSIRQVISGSGPLRPETATAFEERFGIAVRQIYGLSENTAVLTVTPDRHGPLPPEFRGSVGTAVPHVRLEVRDPESQKPCNEGQIGEMAARGGMLMWGYVDNESANQEAFRDDWFHSGDLGHWRWREDGKKWYFLDGRLKEVILRGGETIIPHAIDSVAQSHPAVRRAATIPFANRWYGEEVAIYVVLEHQVEERELLQWCAERLGHQRAPKVVIFGDDIPVTMLGKIRRSVLAERMAEQLAVHWDTSFRAPRA